MQRSAQRGRMPIGDASWDDAQALVARLNERVAGGGFRLPTEAEWEGAARAGGESNEAFDLPTPRLVEQGQPNRLGFFDLAGNIREWCSSRLARSLPETPPVLPTEIPAPVIPNETTVIAEDPQGRVFLLADTTPWTVLTWDEQQRAMVSAASLAGVQLTRAGREALDLKSGVFPGQTTRDQHANSWRLVPDPKDPQVRGIEVRAADTDNWHGALDPSAQQPGAYRSLVADDIGYVWISTPNSVLCLDPRKPKNDWTWTAPQRVTALGLSPRGRALAGLADGRCYELGRAAKGQGVSERFALGNLPAKPIRAIHTDSQGSVWAVVGKAIYRAAPAADAWQRHWRALARMPVANHDIFSAVLPGKLYVFGGMANHGYPAKYTYFNDLFVLDVRGNRWEIVSHLDPARSYNGCAAMAGRIWVIGGRVLDKEPVPIDRVDIYNPDSGLWETGPPLPTPRSEAVILPVNDRIYVIGGVSGKGDPRSYDTLSIGPAENTWRREPAPPGGALSQSSGCVIDGAIYTFSPQAHGVLRYDPTTRVWDQLPPPPGEITLWAALCGAHEGELWVMGGNTEKRPTFIYSPTTRSWRSGPELPTPLGWTSAQEVDGRFLITPGGIAMRSLDDFIFTDTPYELRPAAESRLNP